MVRLGPTHFNPPFVLLEDRLTVGARARLYERPTEIVRCDRPEHVDAAFERLEDGLRRGLHAAGVLAYELGHALEPRLYGVTPTDEPKLLLLMGLFPPPRLVAVEEIDAAFAELAPPPPLEGLRCGHDRGAHVAKVERILELIAAGDIYQANLTFPIHFRYAGDPLSLYAALRVRQPTAHGGMVALGDVRALSISPELFLRVADGEAQSRPMKGTAARGGDPAADEAAVRVLMSDPKQRAENLMITDLIRNDLARIAHPGSVRVPHLLTVETHPTFHALTSTVTARLKTGLGLRDQMAALFPCGSIVGAPKIRAAQVLKGLEDGARGVYTGAIGAFGPDGGADLNVAIRTVVVHPDGTGVYGVGGGIVADSDPDAEYDEARLKALVLEDLARDYGLIETLRWSAGLGFVRLPRHLDRLARSAVALEFVFDRSAAQMALTRRAEAWVAAGASDRRVRLVLLRTGALTVEDDAAPAPDAGTARVGFATVRLDAGDPFLRHKTTRRDVYDLATAEAAEKGWADAIILNRSGHLADGSRHNVFARLGGRLVTPPVTAGALPGVLRADLVETGAAFEGALTPNIVASADALFIGNSLRGLRKASIG